MKNDKSVLSGIVIWGIITADINLISEVQNKIEKDYGKVKLKSQIIPFDFTDYYEKEIGKDLKRCWLFTEKLVPLDELAKIKLHAIEIEKTFFNANGQRRLNLDPGFLTLSNFVLATTKNYGHRIYLRDGIFAEVSLIYQNKTFHILNWTYPDYRNTIDFFNEARNHLKELLNKKIFKNVL